MVSNRGDPETPAMASLTQRLRTFTDWKLTGIHSSKSIAEAGFYYKGKVLLYFSPIFRCC